MVEASFCDADKDQILANLDKLPAEVPSTIIG